MLTQSKKTKNTNPESNEAKSKEAAPVKAAVSEKGEKKGTQNPTLPTSKTKPSQPIEKPLAEDEDEDDGESGCRFCDGGYEAFSYDNNYEKKYFDELCWQCEDELQENSF